MPIGPQQIPRQFTPPAAYNDDFKKPTAGSDTASKNSKTVQVRIIGGKWKGRKLQVTANRALRPTPARSRETLFNWLRGEVVDSHCLDLFAGSGILGFEALSQGAAGVTWVEADRATCRSLRDAATVLQVPPSNRLLCRDGIAVLKNTQPDSAWDIVFLDPPFAQPQLLSQAMALICGKQLASKYIYVEVAAQSVLLSLAREFACDVHRTTRAGDSHAALLLPTTNP